MLAEVQAQTPALLDLGHAALRDHPQQRTFCLQPGDAVVIDYRLLHGTHHNLADADRYCLVTNLVPSWRQLPAEIKAHLISQVSLPSDAEAEVHPDWTGELLPTFRGKPRDLLLNRTPPECKARSD
jgi:hypothetical protein